jgi:hypothetical protein
MTPVTVLGRAFSVLAMLAGAIFFSMPLAIIGDNFEEAWEEHNLKEAAIAANIVKKGHDDSFASSRRLLLPRALAR